MFEFMLIWLGVSAIATFLFGSMAREMDR